MSFIERFFLYGGREVCPLSEVLPYYMVLHWYKQEMSWGRGVSIIRGSTVYTTHGVATGGESVLAKPLTYHCISCVSVHDANVINEVISKAKANNSTTYMMQALVT